MGEHKGFLAHFMNRFSFPKCIDGRNEYILFKSYLARNSALIWYYFGQTLCLSLYLSAPHAYSFKELANFRHFPCHINISHLVRNTVLFQILLFTLCIRWLLNLDIFPSRWNFAVEAFVTCQQFLESTRESTGTRRKAR